jgi:hypothetical protein
MSLNPIILILIGLILLAGLIWQGLLFRADVQKGYPGRLVLPFYLSLFLLLGVIVYALLISLDVYQGFDQEKFISLLSWVGLLILGFALKAYFGPMLLALLAIVLLYNYFQGYEFKMLPLLQWYLDTIFNAVPEIWQVLYLILTAGYALITGIADLSEATGG